MSAAVTEILRDAYMGRLTSIRTVQLLAGMDNLTAARRCCVSPHTFRRWRSDRRPNPTAMRLLAIEAGYMPWAGWHGWEIHDGFLFPPGARNGLSPAQVEGLPFFVALTRDLVRQTAEERPESADLLAMPGRPAEAS